MSKKVINNKNKILKNTLTLSIFCCGLLFSCGGYKKTVEFEEGLYVNDSSEILVIDEAGIDEMISHDPTFENTLLYKNAIYEPSIHSVQLHPLRFEMGNPLIHLSFKDRSFTIF